MELAEPFKMTQPAVSRHLKVLEHAGLISRRAEGTRRHCRLESAALDATQQWLAMLQKAFAKSYERLDVLLAEIEPVQSPQKQMKRRSKY